MRSQGSQTARPFRTWAAAGGRRRAVTAAAAAVTGLLLAACGGSAGTPGQSPPTAPSSPAGARGAIEVHSPAFAPGAAIPGRFTCEGSNVPPPLRWSGIPAGTASVALVVDDPDAPGGTYTHWVVFNLPPAVSGIAGGRLPSGAAQALNSGNQAGYTGPCPPDGTHHYQFTIYAERRRLGLASGAALAPALAAIRASAIASGQLVGLFGG
jgi:Raf kinase inhibitor-like YbhB/YbcL family protein